MPAAYRAAAGEGRSRELTLSALMRRFGPQAIIGRGTLYSYEIRRILLAENIQAAYEARNEANNWAEWTQSNPELSDLLNEAERMAQGDNDG
jgi:hypothetical protein